MSSVIQTQACVSEARLRQLNTALQDKFLQFGGVGDLPTIPREFKQDAARSVCSIAFEGKTQQELLEFAAAGLALLSKGLHNDKKTMSLLALRSSMTPEMVKKIKEAEEISEYPLNSLSSKVKHMPNSTDEVRACIDYHQVRSGGIDITASYNKLREGIFDTMSEVHKRLFLPKKMRGTFMRCGDIARCKEDPTIFWPNNGVISLTTVFELKEHKALTRRDAIKSYDLAQFFVTMPSLSNLEIAKLFKKQLVKVEKKVVREYASGKALDAFDPLEMVVAGSNMQFPFIAKGIFMYAKEVILHEGVFYSYGNAGRTEQLSDECLRSQMARFIAVGGQLCSEALGFVYPKNHVQRVAGSCEGGGGLMYGEQGNVKVYLDFDFKTAYMTQDDMVQEKKEILDSPPHLEWTRLKNPGSIRAFIFDGIEKLPEGMEMCVKCGMIDKVHKCNAEDKEKKEAAQIVLTLDQGAQKRTGNRVVKTEVPEVERVKAKLREEANAVSASPQSPIPPVQVSTPLTAPSAPTTPPQGGKPTPPPPASKASKAANKVVKKKVSGPPPGYVPPGGVEWFIKNPKETVDAWVERCVPHLWYVAGAPQAFFDVLCASPKKEANKDQYLSSWCRYKGRNDLANVMFKGVPIACSDDAGWAIHVRDDSSLIGPRYPFKGGHILWLICNLWGSTISNVLIAKCHMVGSISRMPDHVNVTDPGEYQTYEEMMANFNVDEEEEDDADADGEEEECEEEEEGGEEEKEDEGGGREVVTVTVPAPVNPAPDLMITGGVRKKPGSRQVTQEDIQ